MINGFFLSIVAMSAFSIRPSLTVYRWISNGWSSANKMLWPGTEYSGAGVGSNLDYLILMLTLLVLCSTRVLVCVFVMFIIVARRDCAMAKAGSAIS